MCIRDRSESYELDKLTVTVLGLVSYVVVSPKTLTLESGEVATRILQFDWLGTKGILTAIITSFITVEIFRFCIKKNATIKMPDSVPTMVINAFTALIPGVLIVSVMLIINGICMVISGSLPEAIFSLIQLPLQVIISQPVSYTHLDVYKRQVSPLIRIFSNFATPSASVTAYSSTGKPLNDVP